MKGYIRREFSVWCGVCGGYEYVPHAFTMKAAGKEAVAWGYKKDRKLGYICPTCLKARKRLDA